MSEATAFEIVPGTLPADIPPQTEDHAGNATDYDPEYPGSTKDAPYGFFEDGPQKGQPRKRRPKGSSSGGKSSSKMPAAKLAEPAAAMLSSLLGLTTLVFNLVDMTETSEKIRDSLPLFEMQAAIALSSDPALCKKILGTGGISSGAGLAIAGGTLAAAVYPVAKREYRATHPKEVETYGD